MTTRGRTCSRILRSAMLAAALAAAVIGLAGSASGSGDPVAKPAGVSWFVQATDPHMRSIRKQGRDVIEGEIRAFVEAMNRVVHPEFVVWTGDISDGRPREDAEDDYRSVLKATESLEAPQYFLGGNHDVESALAKFWPARSTFRTDAYEMALVSTWFCHPGGSRITGHRQFFSAVHVINVNNIMYIYVYLCQQVAMDD